MNKERAQEIAQSPVMVNVTYNGQPVYIEKINESNHTADIHMLNQPENKQEVSLSSLFEHYKQ